MLSNPTNRTLEPGITPVQRDSIPLSPDIQPISKILRRGIAHWDALRGSRPWPLRADLQPEDIVRLLPYTFLLDVLDGGQDFRYRLIGTDVVANTERDNTGKRLSALQAQGSQSILARFYRDCFNTQAPRLQRIAYVTRLGLRCWYEAVVLPLAWGDETPCHLILGFAEHFNEVIE